MKRSHELECIQHLITIFVKIADEAKSNCRWIGRAYFFQAPLSRGRSLSRPRSSVNSFIRATRFSFIPMMADSNSAASMTLSELVSYSATISTTTYSVLGHSPTWRRSVRANNEALAGMAFRSRRKIACLSDYRGWIRPEIVELKAFGWGSIFPVNLPGPTEVS